MGISKQINLCNMSRGDRQTVKSLRRFPILKCFATNQWILLVALLLCSRKPLESKCPKNKL